MIPNEEWKQIFNVQPSVSDVSKCFCHRGIIYPFNWSKQHHLEYQKQNLPESRELWRYLNRISREDFPIDLFNDETIRRISGFRINGLERGLAPKIGQQLIDENLIHDKSIENNIVNLTQQCIQLFEVNGIGYKLNHDVILRNLLKEDKSTIACEVPIWKDDSEPITGHIDLIRIDEHTKTLQIIDYKPEGQFMHSLPQVAFYGILIKKNLKIENCKCYSFNKKSIWEYEPEKTLKRTSELLQERRSKQFDWQMYI